MPYNPSTGVYTLPAIYLAIPGTTIIAAQHNEPLVDLQTANNYARPIEAGGTNAPTASGARTELEVPGLPDTNTFTARNSWAKGADIVSALALTLGTDGNYFHVTGGNTITSIAAIGGAGPVYLEFDGVLTLTHNATSLILPGGANITTAAGDVAIFVQESSGNWRCISYLSAAGAAPSVSGTWTPSFTFSTPGNLSVIISSRAGIYTRVGKLVVASFGLTTSTFTHTTASGTFFLTGLPLAVDPGIGVALGQSAFAGQGITKAGYTNFTWQPTVGATTAALAASGSGQNLTSITAADMPSGGNVIIRGTIVYQVA